MGGAAYGQNLMINLETSARSSAVAEPSSTRFAGGSEGQAVSSREATANEEPSTASTHHGAHNEEAASESHARAHGEGGHGTREHAREGQEGGAWVGSKGGMPPAPPTVAAQPQVMFTAETGYQSKYTWRGDDIVQFTSYNAYNNALPGSTQMSDPRGEVYFIGMSATYNGWAFGAKYVQSLSNDYNPFFAPLLSTRDSYSEYIFSVNYTYAVLPDRWLNVTGGFDYYWYPDAEFWGVNQQGLTYIKLVSPHYDWVKPFINLFYNVPTSSQGYGDAAPGAPDIRPGLNGGAVTGARLVEGWGAEIGTAGGAQVAKTGPVTYGVAYSLSTTYKNGYAYEPNGLSHISGSLSLPVNIGGSVTISPSVNYVCALHNEIRYTGGPDVGQVVPGSGEWNKTGFWWGLKLSYSF